MGSLNRPGSTDWLTLSLVLLALCSRTIAFGQSGSSPYASSVHPLMAEYTVAWQLEGQRRPDDAIPLLKAIITKDKTFYRAYDLLLASYAQKNELDKAEEYFRGLAEQEPANGLAHYGLGRVYDRRGLNDRAGEEFAICIQSSPHAHVCYEQMAEEWVLKNPAELQRRLPRDRENPCRYLALAAMYQLQHNIAEALETGRIGLEKARASGDLELQAALHCVLSRAYSFAGEDVSEMLSHNQQALGIYKQLGDWEGQFQMALQSLACDLRLGQFDQAVALIQNYYAKARQFEHRRWESVCLSTMADYFAARGENEAALDAYRESCRLRDTYDLAPGDVQTERLIAGIYRKMGRLSEALEVLEGARRRTLAVGYKTNEAFVLRSIGVLCEEMGDYVKALRYQMESVRLLREQGRGWPAGAGVSNIAAIYATLGSYALANTYYEESLASARQYHDAGEEQRLLNELGALFLRLDRPKAALVYLTQAAAMAERVRYEPFRADILLNTGDAYMRLGRYPEALESIRGSLNVARALGSKPLEAETLAALGDCFLRMGDFAGSQTSFSESLALGDQAGLAQVVVAAHRGLADVLRNRHEELPALEHLRTAIDTIEAQRNSVPAPDLRASFVARNWRVYSDVVDVLSALHAQDLGKGYDRMAFDYAERGRARSLLDTLSEAKTHVTAGLTEEQSSRQSALLSAISKASAALLQDRSALTKQALEQSERNLNEWAIQLRTTNPKYQELQYPEAYSLDRIQSSIAVQNAAALEYALGAVRSQLWVITANRVVMVALPGRDAIEKTVKAYRSAIARHPSRESNSGSDLQHASRLYKFLVEPAVKYLARERKLVIVPDGPLYYLPFETLIRNTAPSQPGFRYLVEDYTVVYAPSASVFASLQQGEGRNSHAQQRELVAYGDPVFSARGSVASGKAEAGELVRSAYQRSGVRFAPLPNTRVEVREIAKLFPPGMRTVHLGHDASKVSVKNEYLEQYRRIHFATHAVIDEEIPARSGLVLSLVDASADDGILRMAEIFNLKLDADLVVLSACQTGLGKLIKGEGMVGLTRAFMYAGTPRVAVSLWEVNDLATADFMKAFYRSMKAGQTPAAALRAAKLSMIHSSAHAYHHPYFWAPFVLVGLF